jgi:predicted RNA methylase
MKAVKKYSIPYWTKQALRYASHPNDMISTVVRDFITDPDSCPVMFDGQPQELLRELYIEHRKKSTVHLALFPTPPPVADDLARLMGLDANHRVFDPCAGLGDLLLAAERAGATAYGLEIQKWLPPLLSLTGLHVRRGDYLDCTPPLPSFTTIIVNPPFGRILTYADVATDFMERIANTSPPGTLVGAILPPDFFTRGSKRRLALKDRYRDNTPKKRIEKAFAPLTNVSVDLYVLTTR